jgi:hypothetical protein
MSRVITAEGSSIKTSAEVETRHLTIDGLPYAGANANANGNYSVTPAYFWMGVRPGEAWFELRSLTFCVEMTGQWTNATYGSLSGLTNGVQLQLLADLPPGGAVLQSYFKSPIKHNGEYNAYCNPLRQIDTLGGASAQTTGTWTLDFVDAGQAVRLDGTRVIAARYSDDFTDTAVVHHWAIAKGVSHTAPP